MMNDERKHASHTHIHYHISTPFGHINEEWKWKTKAEDASTELFDYLITYKYSQSELQNSQHNKINNIRFKKVYINRIQIEIFL